LIIPEKNNRPKIIKVSTVPMSLDLLLKGQLRYLSEYYEIIGLSGGGPILKKVAEREGIRVKSISMKRSISPFFDLYAIWRLYIFFKKEKPQIVHSITPKAGLLAMLASYLARVPIRVHMFTGLIFPYKKGWLKVLLIWMDRFICKMATHVYPEGNGVKNDLLSYKITQKTLKIIGNGNVNGIDTKYFSNSHFSANANKKNRDKLGISDLDIVFIFVGRVVTDKGINELVSAFIELQKQFINCSLLIVGPFEDKLDPISKVSKEIIKNHPKIISTGFVEDVRPYFAMSDLMVFPSYREGFPNVVLQSLAMGIPALVTDINGCNEIVVDGINGWIVPSKNTAALFDKMKDAYLQNEKLAALKLNTRQSVLKYDRQLLWKAMRLEYQKLLGEIS
jgi:glycosyltransferase involved in cell wall biosynthesis